MESIDREKQREIDLKESELRKLQSEMKVYKDLIKVSLVCLLRVLDTIMLVRFYHLKWLQEIPNPLIICKCREYVRVICIQTLSSKVVKIVLSHKLLRTMSYNRTTLVSKRASYNEVLSFDLTQ